MAGFRCYICGKGRVFGRAVSHSGVRTSRIFRPNLQWRHIMFDGQTTRVRLCTKCIKRLKKEVPKVSSASKVTEPQTPATV